MDGSAFHEPLRRDSRGEPGSDRSFGLLMGFVLLAIAALPLAMGDRPRWWLLPGSAAFLAIALWRPTLLRPLNRAWMRLGDALHRVVSPLVLAALFYVVLTPFALVRRAFAKDPLRLRFDPNATTYWIARSESPRPAPMRDQF